MGEERGNEMRLHESSLCVKEPILRKPTNLQKKESLSDIQNNRL